MNYQCNEKVIVLSRHHLSRLKEIGMMIAFAAK